MQNCLHRRQFAWNVKFCFTGKNKKNNINLSSADFVQSELSVNALMMGKLHHNDALLQNTIRTMPGRMHFSETLYQNIYNNAQKNALSRNTLSE